MNKEEPEQEEPKQVSFVRVQPPFPISSSMIELLGVDELTKLLNLILKDTNVLIYYINENGCYDFYLNVSEGLIVHCSAKELSQQYLELLNQ